jgi:Ala-tRNA(Pro) deacylase
MAIAARLKWYLDANGVQYDIVPHPHTASSHETAAAAHIPEDQLAKSVVLEDEQGYVLAVLPASRRVAIGELREQLNRSVELATEGELGELFEDCETGAIPAVGAAYGIPSVVDDALLEALEIYFEAGDHEDLVHMRGEEFLGLLSGSPHGRFSYPD